MGAGPPFGLLHPPGDRGPGFLRRTLEILCRAHHRPGRDRRAGGIEEFVKGDPKVGGHAIKRLVERGRGDGL